jgi:hypothetical protein
MKYWAGVGSRETPDHISDLLSLLAAELERCGWILRSGGADGADTFFERGVREDSNKQIFIHKEYAHGRQHNVQKGVYNAQRYADYAEAVKIASEIHPAWHRCSEAAQQLHARNVYQVLGPGLNPETYSKFLVCWAIPDIHGVPEGGTRTAWNIAVKYNIPRFNLAVRADRERIADWLSSRQAL